MMQAYFKNNENRRATFDTFFRYLPKNRGYLIVAGLEQICDYLKKLNFGKEEIEFLKERGFEDDFLDFLSKLKFTGDVYAFEEGSLVFPNEPVVRITAPLIEAQLLETFVINQINFQTLIATKASRMVEVAGGRTLVDFGSRRAHGIDAGLKAARASYIGGFNGTSNVLASRVFGIPVFGTMAHSFVMSFPSEIESFNAYVKVYDENSILLIDTYDTIQGAKNAVKIAEDLKKKKGCTIKGIRLDSGDFVKLSKTIRKIFDESGFPEIKIFISSGLDEYSIEDMLRRGAKVDGFGVGTKLVTSSDQPMLECVYKLVEYEDRDGVMQPKIKLSLNKVTYPGRKQVWRIEKDSKFVKDVLALDKEVVKGGEPKLVKIFENGKLVYKIPSLKEIRKRVRDELIKLPERYRRIKNPAKYRVEISPCLSELINELKLVSNEGCVF